MRQPEYISPSAFMLWQKDAKEYTLRHLCNNRPPRMPQELPAAVGSSFDAWVKSNLYAALFGTGSDPQFEFSAIFESQVDEINRDVVHEMGLRCFDNYVHTGAYDELLELMQDAQEDPQFEFSAKGTIEGIPMLGKPDCRFVSRDGIHIILDWKVKGYCSKWGASPNKHYRLCRDGLEWPKPSRSDQKAHKGYRPFDFKGLEIHEGWMEEGNAEWAIQLAIYGWLLGMKPGDEDVVVCIDEIVSKSRQDDGLPPLLRVANHRARISENFQRKTLNELRLLWDSIQSGWIRTDMSREDSDAWFEACQEASIGLASDGTAEENWYNQIARPAYRR